jgi:predicted MPP superfamily phosphohydrolase
MHRLLDLIIVPIMIWAQWQLARMALRATAEKRPRASLRPLRAALAAFYAPITAGYICSFTDLVAWIGVPAWPSAVLSGTAYTWLFCSTGAYLIYVILRFLSGRLFPEQFSPARRRLLNTAGGALVASPVVLLGYGALVQRTAFRVREVDLPVPGLPRDLNNLRLVQLTDIHLSAFLSEQELARVVDAANELRPQVALVTGDLISSGGDPLDACLRQLARLRADAGVVGCLGNHEIYARAEDYAAIEGARLGLRFLRGDHAELRFGGSAVNFAGVDYQPIFRRSEYLKDAERLLRPGALNVLLSHNPDVFPVAARKGYNLTISGHTHGGQVTVEILNQSVNPARFLTPFVYGRYQQGSALAYVSSGIGTVGLPARIGAPPEIALLRLRSV